MIEARWTGKCPGCGEPIIAGEPIGRVDGDWCCAECVDEHGEEAPHINHGEPE